jgi:prophage regulatory protein
MGDIPETAPLGLLRLPAVMAITGLSRSSVYSYIAKKTFPQPVGIGGKRGRSIAFVRSEVEDWIRHQIQASRDPVGEPERRAKRCGVEIARQAKLAAKQASAVG